jgi:hypothetical protein
VSFTDLALVCAVALAGPLLATPRRWRLPVVLGELVAGVLLGASGFGVLDAGDTTFAFLGSCGFVLVMFVAGTHVPVRDPRLRTALRTGATRAALVGLVAVGLGYGVAELVGTSHALVYAVLMASSSAAIVLPTVDSLRLAGPDLVDLLPQVAIADSVCIVLLPLVIDPDHVARAAVGAVAVIVAGVVLLGLLRWVEHSGWRERVHDVSEDRQFAVELRVSLAVVFAMAALAVAVHVSLMLAGFVSGLAVAAVGEPRRVAKQLFAVTEGSSGRCSSSGSGRRSSSATWSTTLDDRARSLPGCGCRGGSPGVPRPPPAHAVRHARQRPARRPGGGCDRGPAAPRARTRRGSRPRPGCPGGAGRHRCRRLPRGSPANPGAGGCVTSAA